MAQRVKHFANVKPDLRKVLRRLLILLGKDTIDDKLVLRAEDSAAASLLFISTQSSACAISIEIVFVKSLYSPDWMASHCRVRVGGSCGFSGSGPSDLW